MGSNLIWDSDFFRGLHKILYHVVVISSLKSIFVNFNCNFYFFQRKILLMTNKGENCAKSRKYVFSFGHPRECLSSSFVCDLQ